jgi:hypothetical protein
MEAFRIYLNYSLSQLASSDIPFGRNSGILHKRPPKVAQPTQSLSFVVLYQSAVRI